jgi:hypothetical protein
MFSKNEIRNVPLLFGIFIGIPHIYETFVY